MGNPRILLNTDSPNLNTGFGRLAKELILQLQDSFDIDVISPYTHLPLSKFGKNTTIYALNHQIHESLPMQTEELLRAGAYDIFFIIGPFDVVQDYCKWFKQRGGLPPMVAYIPIEQEYLNGWQVKDLDYLKKIVFFHPLARKIYKTKAQHQDNDIWVIEHGVDTETFRPLKDKMQMRREGPFKIADNELFFITVATNQWRKNPYLGIVSFLRFDHTHPDYNAKYYIHMARGGAAGNLPRMIETAKNQLEYAYGKPVRHSGIILPAAEEPYGTDKELNELYNMADATISTSIGEGWNFQVSESMATQTLAVAPNHTAHRYLLNYDRGILIKTSRFEMATSYGYNEVARNVISSNEVLAALEYVGELKDKDGIEEKAYNGYMFIKQERFTWPVIGEKWKQLFFEVLK